MEGLFVETIAVLEKEKKVLPWIRNLIFCLALLSIAGCAGGGTSGTGIKMLEGQVLSESGKPLAGVEVSIPETGQTTQTASDGTYSILTSTSSEEIQVDVEVDGVTSSLVVEDVPEGGAIVNLDMAISEETGEISDSTVEITPVTVGEDEELGGGEETPPSSAASSSVSSEEELGQSSDISSSVSSDDSSLSSPNEEENGNSSSAGTSSSTTPPPTEEDPVNPPDDSSEEDPDGDSGNGGEESG